MSQKQQRLEQQAPRYRVGVLLYFSDEQGRLLLIRRKRPPNKGLWCAVGGKLEMPLGESPYECAIREAKEEVGVALRPADLSLRCLLAEKDYEGTGHWLMFVFQVTKPLLRLPAAIEEGEFRFAAKEQLLDLQMPELDRHVLCERLLPGPGDLQFLRYDGSDSPLVEEGRVRA